MKPVAIIGQGCVLPGALSPQSLWDAVVGRRNLISSAPADRWGLPRADIMGAPETDQERTWSDKGGYVSGFEQVFDPSDFGLDSALVGQLDPLVQWLLHAGRQALSGVNPRSPGRSGIVIGNLAFPSSGMSRYAERGWLGDTLADAAGLPRPPAHDRFMAGLPAHLVAQGLGLHGAPSYALDAACASSLYAIKMACDLLEDGRADMMLAGAVNRADDLFIHVGFCALRAMSRTGQSRPFHRGADGLVPAEGAGLVVLKRLEDAQRDGDPILGVIRGVGLSNDGRGKGLLVPSQNGQVRAMAQAWQNAGLDPSSATLIECHATGTTIGDSTELESMAQVFKGHRDLPIGSLKSHLGHLITAAGVGGLIKVLGSIKHGVRPPMLNTDAPIEALDGSPFRLLKDPEPWDGLRRAAISAFGFGGNNAHLIVEAHDPQASFVPAPAAPKPEVAIVGMGAVVGDGTGLGDFEDVLFGQRPANQNPAKDIELSMRALRFPPKDLEQTLAQQLMVFKAATEALSAKPSLNNERTGVLIGMGTDAEVARYGARWRIRDWARAWGVEDEAWVQEAQNAFVPALAAAGVLGTMPNIPANRINNQFNLSGPSMAVCSEELSGVRALQIAARALQNGEMDAAVVGAVDLSHEPTHQRALAQLGRALAPGDGAVVLVLKRLEDARKDGDAVLAVLDDAAQPSGAIEEADITARFGHAHAASGLLQVAAAVSCCARARQLGGAPWQGPRAVSLNVHALAGQQAQVGLRGEGPAQALRPSAPLPPPALRFKAHMTPVQLPSVPQTVKTMTQQTSQPNNAQLMAPAPALPSVFSEAPAPLAAAPVAAPAPAAAPAVTNGHVANGHITNGHVSNGHVANGHVANGHVANGHAAANGHASNGHAPVSWPAAPMPPVAPAMPMAPMAPTMPVSPLSPMGDVYARFAAAHAQMSAVHKQFMAQQQAVHQRFQALTAQVAGNLLHGPPSGAASYMPPPMPIAPPPMPVAPPAPTYPSNGHTAPMPVAPAPAAPVVVQAPIAKAPVATPVVKAPAPAAKPVVVKAPVAKKVQAPASDTAALVPKRNKPAPTGMTLDRDGLKIHASGKISEIFGPLFEQQDGYKRQVRMPEPPLLLADRMTGVDAKPGVLGRGSMWTETDVKEDSWYLHEGRMPAGIMIESGQADLMLISYMGIDFLNQSDRIYRLLGCELTYHGSLPKPGETLCYDIHIDGHAKQGDVRLFFFHYDCEVNGEPRLTVRGGQAGFFTEEELGDSMGILWKPETGERCDNPRLAAPAVALQRERFERHHLESFAKGDVSACFGPGFEKTAAHTRTPRIAGSRMLFLETITEINHTGGPWGRGYLRAEDHISPDDWFFNGHFKNDPCMPGTLMFEGCLQAMACYMTSMGYTIDRDGWRFEPVPEEKYLMRCRGQVSPTSKLLTYEVFIEEVIDGPIPTIFADLLCTVDGLGAFHCRRMGLRLVPDWPLEDRADLRLLGAQQSEGTEVASWEGFDFDYASLLACAWGKPTTAFGPAYAAFDSERTVPRLPGPPYHFMSRINKIDGTPWSMQIGTEIDVEYDIPSDAWYFQENGAATMPFAVLLEAALQPCGWLASLSGSTLGTDVDMSFRNLDGTGTLMTEVLPTSGTLKTHVKITNISRAGSMIIEAFEVQCRMDGELVYEMDTVFGFFPQEALAAQKGLPSVGVAKEAFEAPQGEVVDLTARPERYFGGSANLSRPSLLMIDRVVLAEADGGQEGLGRYRAEKDVDPAEWFFEAHFFQDPVQPGSLGIEAMIQALQFAMLHKGMDEGMTAPRFEPLGTGQALTWKYRGQVLTHNKLISTTLDIVEEGEDDKGRYVVATASLWVDGMRIYEATGLGMRLVEGQLPETSRTVTLDPVADAWLGDHCPTWTVPALPMMSMLDLMASAAAREGRRVVSVKDVKVARWLPIEAPVTLYAPVEGLFKDVKVRLHDDEGEVASGRFETSLHYVAGPPPWAPINAPVQPDAYEAGVLFHGPAFQAMTQWRLGSNGASAILDAAPGSIPPGALGQRLLDAATHAIPHDNLHLWSDQIPEGMVAYPAFIPEATFHCATPLEGQVRCEVRFDGFFGSKRFPAFRIQLIDGDRVWATMKLVEALFPKGPIGQAKPDDRRAFLGERQFVPGVGLSSEVGEGEQSASVLKFEDLAASDWLPGTIEAVFGTTDPAEIALREHLSRKVALHPGVMPAALPLNHFPVEVEQDDVSVTVRDSGAESLDLEPVKAYWTDWFQRTDWAVEDVYYGLIEQFVRRVVLTDPQALAAIKGRPALFLCNHQVACESLLFSILTSGLLGLPTLTLAKAEHRHTWVGKLIKHCFSYPEIKDPGVIAFFDREDKASLPGIIKDLAGQMAAGTKSVMVHVEGTRSLSSRTPVQKMSGAFIDMAMAVNAPIVPVRFIGGLPAEPLESRLEFPIGMGQQDIWYGRPLMPEELAAMPYGDRKRLVINAINGLGPDNAVEAPLAGDPALEAAASDWQSRSGAEAPHAVIKAVLENLDNPTETTRFILGQAPAPKDEALAKWATELKERLNPSKK